MTAASFVVAAAPAKAGQTPADKPLTPADKPFTRAEILAYLRSIPKPQGSGVPSPAIKAAQKKLTA